MKKELILFIVVAILIILFSLWYRTTKNSVLKESSTIESENGNLTNSLVVASPTKTPIATQNSSDVISHPSDQESSRDKTPQEIIAEKNSKSQDFYGQAVDQYGQPVIDANVSATLITETEEGFTTENFTAQSGANGLFQLVGLHGADLNVKVKKDGYKYGDRGEGFNGSVDGKTNPNNRAILTMWKISGAQPLVSENIVSGIPYDGSPVTFDRITGKESSDGDLRVALSRFPQQLKPGLVHPYDWQFKMEIIGGGLIKESDPYPYFAPDSGYLSSFEFQINSNTVPWESQIEQNFYIKTSQGQYGRMQMTLYSAQKTPTIQISLTINPAGSQNLEPDFSK